MNNRFPHLANVWDFVFVFVVAIVFVIIVLVMVMVMVMMMVTPPCITACIPLQKSVNVSLPWPRGSIFSAKPDTSWKTGINGVMILKAVWDYDRNIVKDC